MDKYENETEPIPGTNGRRVKCYEFSTPGWNAVKDLNRPIYTLSSRVAKFLLFSLPEGEELPGSKNVSFDDVKRANATATAKVTLKKRYYGKGTGDKRKCFYVEEAKVDKDVQKPVGVILRRCLDPEDTGFDDLMDAAEKESMTFSHYFDTLLEEAHLASPHNYVHDCTFRLDFLTGITHPCNLELLDTPCRRAKVFGTGINRLWLYVSEKGTVAPIHLEDWSLSSFNSQYGGHPKLLFFIDPEDMHAFEEKYEKLWDFAKDEKHCPGRFRTRRGIVPLKTLDEWGIRWYLAVMKPGMHAIIGCRTYHFVYNLGNSINAAVNYVDENYATAFHKNCNCSRKDDDDRAHQKNPDFQDRFFEALRDFQTELRDEIKNEKAKAVTSSEPIASTSKVCSCQAEVESARSAGPSTSKATSHLVSKSKKLPSSSLSSSSKKSSSCTKGKGRYSKRPLAKPKKCAAKTAEFPCPKCEQWAWTPGDLKRHFRSVHTKDLQEICSECGKTFANRSSLQRHAGRTNHSLTEEQKEKKKPGPGPSSKRMLSSDDEEDESPALKQKKLNDESDSD